MIEIFGGIWMALSWASYAQFIDLPDIPFLTGMSAIFASAAANGAWWGFVRPAILRRKEALSAQDNERVTHGRP